MYSNKAEILAVRRTHNDGEVPHMLRTYETCERKSGNVCFYLSLRIIMDCEM